jgi:formylglycine-generating enzyme required for sulfatase activity
MIAGEHRLALPAGYQLGKYRFKEVLGAGGFGITYLAEDGSLGRRVAIKELLPNDIATRLDGSTVVAKTKSEEANLAWARDRFVKEGRALAACEHPNVVHVYEMVEANGTAYMVTKFEEGRSFSEWLKEVGGAPTEKELRAILLPLLSGLEKVHKAGFLHRDLKPENIYITDDGRPVLLDFGSARQAVTDRTTSMTSIVTSGYAPFEQYHEDGQQGAWTDIYALGAVLYRAIHGKKPPEATRRLKDDPCLKLAREYAGKYTPQFLTAIDKALSVEHAKRPQSVAEWKHQIGVAPAEEKIVADPEWVRWVATAQAWLRGHPLLAAGAAAGVLVLALIAWKLLAPPAPEPKIAVVEPTPAPVPKPPVENLATPDPKPAPPKVEPPKNSTVWDTFKKVAPGPVELPKLGPRTGQKWTNSLGQVFAWVPGQPIHMAVWETRRGDFEAFVRATGYDATAGVFSWTTKGWKTQGATWVNPGFPQTPAHPVVGVSAYDALAFCRWLTEKDRAAGLIDQQLIYRLPTDDEWGRVLQEWRFPWGDQWPPTVGAGNYAGEEAKTTLGSNHVIASYRDGFTGTAPVGTFQGNAAGFHDLGGNVGEICGTWYRKEMNPAEVREKVPEMEKYDPASSGPAVVIRGGSWFSFNPYLVFLGTRDYMRPQERYTTVGFRCVLAPAGGQPAFVLPSLQAQGESPLPEIDPAAPVDRKLVAIWEAKITAPTGSATARWEQNADGHYSVTTNGTTTDTGTLTASNGRIRQISETSGLTIDVTYQFKTTTQLLTNGPLGSATWKRIKALSADPKGTEPDPDKDDPKPRPRPKEDDDPPHRDFKREIKKRLPFHIPGF